MKLNKIQEIDENFISYKDYFQFIEKALHDESSNTLGKTAEEYLKNSRPLTRLSPLNKFSIFGENSILTPDQSKLDEKEILEQKQALQFLTEIQARFGGRKR